MSDLTYTHNGKTFTISPQSEKGLALIARLACVTYPLRALGEVQSQLNRMGCSIARVSS